MSDERYQQRQQRVKEKVDARVAQAQDERGIIIVSTGNGKGKTTAAFGTATRAVGHGKKVGVVQFIKGTWPNGERNLLEPHGVEFQVMATGFTWDTQNRESDTAACREVWQHAKRMLAERQQRLASRSNRPDTGHAACGMSSEKGISSQPPVTSGRRKAQVRGNAGFLEARSL